MKKSPKKLSLNRETLHGLEQVTGGALPYSDRCVEQESVKSTCWFGFCYTASCPNGCIGPVTEPVTLY